MKKFRFALSIVFVALAGDLWLVAQVRDFASHRGHAAQSGGGRLAELAADRQRLGLQPARSNQPAGMPAAAARVVVGDGRTGAQEATPLVSTASCTCRIQRGVIQALDGGHRRLDLGVSPRGLRQAPARRRSRRRRTDRHPAPRSAARGRHGRRRRRHGTRHSAEPRDFRRQDLRHDQRRARHRARRADRESASGTWLSRTRSSDTATRPARSSCAAK